MSSGAGALCALHPDQRAERICERCGNFMCSACSQQGARVLCPTCAALVGGAGFGLRRDNWDFGKLWDRAWEAFRREWLMLCVAVVVFAAAIFAVAMVGQVIQLLGGRDHLGVLVVAALAQQVIQLVVQTVLQVGLFRLLIDVLNGGKVDLSRLLSQFPKLGTIIGQSLMIGLLVTVPLVLYMAGTLVVALEAGGTSVRELIATPWNVDRLPDLMTPAFLGVCGASVLLAVVPFLYFVLPLSFASMELAAQERVGVWESIRNCYAIARGNRLYIFGVGLVAGLLFLAGVLLCCLPGIPAWVLSQLLMTGLFLALRNGAEVPQAV